MGLQYRVYIGVLAVDESKSASSPRSCTSWSAKGQDFSGARGVYINGL